MSRPQVIFCVCALWAAVGHCNTLISQPFNYVPDAGNSYAWIIPPQHQHQLQPTFQQPSPSASSVDQPAGGCGHPLFNRQYSREQLNLPNEFLIAPSDPQRPSPPVFLQLDPVNCNGGTTTTGPNGDCIQQHATQRNLVPVESMPDQRGFPAQPVHSLSSHGGGIGLLFFVPESASHFPMEQLIRQQLVLHRAKLPFDISMNCGEPPTAGCLGVAGVNPSTTATTFNAEHVENVENANYASLPLVKNVNSSGQRQHGGWRNIDELLAQHRQRQLQHQRQLSMLPL